MVGSVPVNPPHHLSAEARAYLLEERQPFPAYDISDTAAFLALREEIHAGWLALNEQLEQPWTHRDDTIADVPVVWFASSEASFESEQVIVHLHGGSYCFGSPMTNASMTVPVAQRTGLPVVSVDYRLAPEHRCPAAVDDATAVLRALSIARDVVAMYGESAGAGLALATATQLRDAGDSVPGRLGLLSPWVDLTISGDSYRTLLAVDPELPDPDEPYQWAAAYAGDDVSSPLASPLFADLAGLPPVLIQVGTREVLLSDSCRLDQALRDAGAPVTLDVWDGLWHVWHLFHHIPEAMQAFDELAAFLVPQSSTTTTD